MFTPRPFEQNDEAALTAFIQTYPFATLVTQDNGQINAMHLPVVLCHEGNKIWLKSHIAKANPVWRSLESAGSGLFIFNGVDGYISPNFYATKAHNPRAVPTWNYTAVHVRASITVRQDAAWLEKTLLLQTSTYEKGQVAPWQLEDAPKDYRDKLISAIVGLECEVTELTGQWKLSQNQPEENKHSVIAGLKANGNPSDALLADAMINVLDSAP